MQTDKKYRISRRAFGSMLVTGSVGASLPLWLSGCATIGAPAGSRAMSPDGLARSSPESQGVDPHAITDFLDEVGALGLELDSFMLYRHGHVVAEGWWWPYKAERVHMMHSLTKSVMVCAVALAMEEGHFGFDDKVISFFKDELPAKVDDKMAAMTVRDLLTMRTGHAVETSGALWRPIHTSWAAEFFKIPVVYQPGTKFVYTSAASYMLSAIVTKTTGQPIREYLEPRFFKPLGITDLQWDLDPSGKINPGGNGLSWRTADSLKLGIVYAQEGMWEGKQILPAKFIREATVSQVETGEYGYQWWMGPNKAYYALGLFVQMSIVFPEHDAVLAVTSAIDGSKLLLPSIWKRFPAAFGAPVTPDTAVDLALRDRCARLRLLPQLEHTTSPVAKQVSGRMFEVATNEDDVRSLRFEFTVDQCLFSLTDARGEHHVTVGLRDWIEGSTSITGNKIHHEYQPDVMRVVAGARWLDAQTFEMTWQFVESAFRDKVVCRFDGDSMTLDRSVNVNEEATKMATLHGKLAVGAR